jgi:DNA-binding XRE family transcriptional regulator
MIRKNLVKFRVDSGLKSQEMAEKLGVGRVHYSNIERGKCDPTFGLMQKFEETFKDQYEDIWEIFKKAE